MGRDLNMDLLEGYIPTQKEAIAANTSCDSEELKTIINERIVPKAVNLKWYEGWIIYEEEGYSSSRVRNIISLLKTRGWNVRQTWKFFGIKCDPQIVLYAPGIRGRLGMLLYNPLSYVVSIVLFVSLVAFLF